MIKILAVFLGLMLSGMPIAFVMAITGGIFLVFQYGFPPTAIAGALYAGLDSFTLMAVPFFVLASGFLANGGIARALVNMADSCVGHYPGGMGIVAVVACMIFAALSGSSVATAMAVGTIVIPEMERLGYPKRLALGLVSVAGTLGILIPPSTTFVLYGLIAEESIGELFVAGIIPGLVIGFGLIIMVVLMARKLRIPRTPRASWAVRIKATRFALPALMMPILVIGGIYTGVFTPTEAAAVSAVYAIGISVLYYQTIPLNRLLVEAAAAMKPAAAIMLIISAALILGKLITITRVASDLVHFVTEQQLPAWLFLAVFGVLMLILGCFMESVSMLLIVVPVVMPLVKALGIDPIHFGVLMVVFIELGLITPPVGMNLFAISAVGKATVADTMRGSIPFFIWLLGAAVLLMYVPALSTWLPGLMYR